MNNSEYTTDGKTGDGTQGTLSSPDVNKNNTDWLDDIGVWVNKDGDGVVGTGIDKFDDTDVTVCDDTGAVANADINTSNNDDIRIAVLDGINTDDDGNITDKTDTDNGVSSGDAGFERRSDNRRYTSLKIFMRDILISFAVALLIVQFINPTIVKGQSMEPTLHDNNYIFLSKQQYTFSEMRHGQIVVFKPGGALAYERKDNLLIKRVIALPGDELTIQGGEVILNGVRVNESYILEPYTSGHVESITIPDGYVFVMGDNRQHSLDSRSPDVGFVSEKQIIGMAFFRVFPFDQFGLIQ